MLEIGKRFSASAQSSVVRIRLLTESGHAVQKKSTESPAARVALAPAAVSPPSLQVISPVVKSAMGPFPVNDLTIRVGAGVVYGSL